MKIDKLKLILSTIAFCIVTMAVFYDSYILGFLGVFIATINYKE
jgi:hypothetical protein